MTHVMIFGSVADPFHFDMDPDPFHEIMDPNGKYQLFFTFFFYKKYISPKYDLFCYSWSKYVSNHNLIVLKKNV